MLGSIRFYLCRKFLSVRRNLRADETTTNVARKTRFVELIPSVEEALRLAAQLWASSNVFVISDKMDNDFPMPISSARMPPPVSGCWIRDLAFVTAWRYLNIFSQFAKANRTPPGPTTVAHLTQLAAKDKIPAGLGQFHAVSWNPTLPVGAFVSSQRVPSNSRENWHKMTSVRLIVTRGLTEAGLFLGGYLLPLVLIQCLS